MATIKMASNLYSKHYLVTQLQKRMILYRFVIFYLPLLNFIVSAESTESTSVDEQSSDASQSVTQTTTIATTSTSEVSSTSFTQNKYEKFAKKGVLNI